MICRQHPEWHLDIVGDGEERTRLQTLIDSYEIGDSTTLCPPSNDMDAVYNNASIIALSSRYEGLPMILLEAQAYGLPIVAFDCKCGPSDVVTNGVDGYLVAEGDCNALSQKLSMVMDNENLRLQMGKEARKNSCRYSEENIMSKWDRLFNQLNTL